MSSMQTVSSAPQSTSNYIPLQSLREGLASWDLPSKLSRSWKRFVRSSGQQVHASATTVVATTSSKTITGEMPAIMLSETLSAEDKKAREKGLQVLARFEYLAETDEGFRRWLQTGFDQAQAGQVFPFDE